MAGPSLSERGYLEYGDTGVDVDVEAVASRIMYGAAKLTWANLTGRLGEVITPNDRFSGVRYSRVDSLPKGTVMRAAVDGTGTKPDLARRAGYFGSLPADLLAMCLDDESRFGSEPVFVVDALEVNTLGRDRSRLPYIQQIADGFVKWSKWGNVGLINGEIAQHNDLMGELDKFKVSLMGFCISFANESRLLDGKKVEEGDYLVGLFSPGFRCNGFSMVRRMFGQEYGPEWENAMFEGKRLIDEALTPSLIYTPALVEMTGGWNLERRPGAEVHAISHITGFGIEGKLAETLAPSGLGAIIDAPFTPSNVVLECQRIGGFPDQEAYKMFNMGQGLIIVTPDADSVGSIAQGFGFEPKVVGRTRREPGITIHSKGLQGAIFTV